MKTKSFQFSFHPGISQTACDKSWRFLKSSYMSFKPFLGETPECWFSSCSFQNFSAVNCLQILPTGQWIDHISHCYVTLRFSSLSFNTKDFKFFQPTSEESSWTDSPAPGLVPRVQLCRWTVITLETPVTTLMHVYFTINFLDAIMTKFIFSGAFVIYI